MDPAFRHHERVPLAIAAAVVFRRVAGTQVEGRRDAATAQTLNAVAHALACMVPIYAGEGRESAKALTPTDLLDGHFERGAALFRARGGIELNHLWVERRDLPGAIVVLRAARIRFHCGDAIKDAS